MREIYGGKGVIWIVAIKFIVKSFATPVPYPRWVSWNNNGLISRKERVQRPRAQRTHCSLFSVLAIWFWTIHSTIASVHKPWKEQLGVEKTAWIINTFVLNQYCNDYVSQSVDNFYRFCIRFIFIFFLEFLDQNTPLSDRLWKGLSCISAQSRSAIKSEINSQRNISVNCKFSIRLIAAILNERLYYVSPVKPVLQWFYARFVNSNILMLFRWRKHVPNIYLYVNAYWF